MEKNIIIIGVLLSAFAGGGLYIKLLRSEVSTAKAEKAEVVSQLQTSEESVKTLKLSIATQNAAVDRLKADSASRESAHKNEILSARKTSSTQKQLADETMKTTPAAGVTACYAANDLLNKRIRQRINK